MAKSRIRFPGLKYVPLVDLNFHIKYELPIEYRKTEEFGGKRDALPYSIPLRGKNLPRNNKDSGFLNGNLLFGKGVRYGLIAEKPISELKAKIIKGIGASSIKNFNSSYQLKQRDGVSKIQIDARNANNKIKVIETSLKVDRSDQVSFKGGQAKDNFSLDSNDFHRIARYKSINIDAGGGSDDVGFTGISVNSKVKLGGGNDKLSIDGSVTNMLNIDAGDGDDIIDWHGSFKQNGKIKAKLGNGNDRFAIADYDSFRNKLPRSIEIDYGEGVNQSLRISGTIAELKRLKLNVKTSGSLGISIKATDLCHSYTDNPDWDKMVGAARRWKIDGVVIRDIGSGRVPGYSNAYRNGFKYGVHTNPHLVNISFEGSTLIECPM